MIISDIVRKTSQIIQMLFHIVSIVGQIKNDAPLFISIQIIIHK